MSNVKMLYIFIKEILALLLKIIKKIIQWMVFNYLQYTGNITLTFEITSSVKKSITLQDQKLIWTNPNVKSGAN